MSSVAVYKHFSQLDLETDSIISGSRVQSTSTPSRIIDTNISTFLRQEEALDFNSDKNYYRTILEEVDDDLLRWYPMRISYSREARALRIKNELLSKHFEVYLHLQQPPTNAFGEVPEDCHEGPIYNMVFVRAMKIQLKLLKRFNPTCSTMRFMPVHSLDDYQTTRILWIPNQQMEDFIDSATRPDPLCQRIPLTYNDFIDKQDRRVRILSGPFEGVTGEVKRIHRHRIVVALIRAAKAAIGITHVPPENLEFLD